MPAVSLLVPSGVTFCLLVFLPLSAGHTLYQKGGCFEDLNYFVESTERVAKHVVDTVYTGSRL